jgi:hypothetical protein
LQDDELRAADELVAHHVDVQMKSATSPEDRLTYGLIPNGADKDQVQSGLLETFELRPGASDVTAYHDFHTLQIAFEHVWTRLFDGELEQLGRQLYTEYVGLKDFLGYDPDADRPISSLDDLIWLIGEVRALSQFTQQSVPTELKGDGKSGGGTEPPKGSGDLTSDLAEVGAAILTGGLSAIASAVLNEISNAGKKPIKRWPDFNGQPLERGDRITSSFEYGVVRAGTIELVLQTDIGSHWKGLALQIWVQNAGKFVNCVMLDNSAMNVVSINGPQYFRSSTVVPATLVPGGVIEFASEESPGLNLGRYVLADLATGDKLRDGARITFYWQDR